MATTIARVTMDTCKAQGYNVSVHVLGREGQVVLGVRHDSAGLATFENSMKKAYTARTFARSSGDFADGIKGNPLAGALRLTNIVPARGALPIKIGNETIGAVGVSGAPGGDKDEACQGRHRQGGRRSAVILRNNPPRTTETVSRQPAMGAAVI